MPTLDYEKDLSLHEDETEQISSRYLHVYTICKYFNFHPLCPNLTR